MAVFETFRAPVAVRPGIFARLISTVITWNDRRITRASLKSLSDHQLRDIGLSHSDIEGL